MIGKICGECKFWQGARFTGTCINPSSALYGNSLNRRQTICSMGRMENGQPFPIFTSAQEARIIDIVKEAFTCVMG